MRTEPPEVKATQSLLYQGNLLQYAATTLAPVHHQFIIKLKFHLKWSQSKNVIKVGVPAEN